MWAGPGQCWSRKDIEGLTFSRFEAALTRWPSRSAPLICRRLDEQLRAHRETGLCFIAIHPMREGADQRA
jgi:hypothetical protein